MRLIEHELIETVQQLYDKTTETGFEKRDGQIEMSLEICEAIVKKKPIAVEAGVGIGKSIAYLVPIILQYFRERRQIVIATSTIALQEQLEKDVQTVLLMIGVKAEVVCALGMKNYICRKRLASYADQHRNVQTTLDNICEIASHSEQTRSRMGIEINDELWDKICIKNTGERCRECQYTNSCQYLQMRSRLKYENCIVICNQNMLVSHLVQKDNGLPGIFNPSNNMIVVDEAHNLEGKFRDSYTNRFSKFDMLNELTSIERQYKGQKRNIAEVKEMLNRVFQYLIQDIKMQKNRSDGDTQVFYFNQGEYVKGQLFIIRRALAELEEKLGLESRTLAFLRELCNLGSKNIIWLENDDVLTFCICKKDIRKNISRLLFKRDASVVLTSATISNSSSDSLAEQYKYFLNSVGFPMNTGLISEPKSSPFDYDKNTMLYVSPDLPNPGHGKEERRQYAMAAIPEIIRLLKITHGKTLILFTAKADMSFVYGRLTNAGLPFKLMIQDDSSSQQRRLERFKADTDSVILGSGTLWEGINIEGESLSQVIIYKLPFPVPDPINQYKMSLVEDPIKEVAVPEMLIKLKQGAGRLIRSVTDRGIVSILDPRVSSSSKAAYREMVLSSLPIKNRTEEVCDLAEFWNGINNRCGRTE